jgi:alcohol dehydrogenase class IV
MVSECLFLHPTGASHSPPHACVTVVVMEIVLESNGDDVRE